MTELINGLLGLAFFTGLYVALVKVFGERPH